MGEEVQLLHTSGSGGMTDHPITPPPELVKQWAKSAECANDVYEVALATQAARWGADQELEACCEWLRESLATPSLVECFLANRRPKPPSLKETAIVALETIEEAVMVGDSVHDNDLRTIRRALEQLDD